MPLLLISLLLLFSGNTEEHSVVRIKNSRLIDSGGGFFINEKELEEEQEREVLDSFYLCQRHYVMQIFVSHFIMALLGSDHRRSCSNHLV